MSIQNVVRGGILYKTDPAPAIGLTLHEAHFHAFVVKAAKPSVITISLSLSYPGYSTATADFTLSDSDVKTLPDDEKAIYVRKTVSGAWGYGGTLNSTGVTSSSGENASGTLTGFGVDGFMDSVFVVSLSASAFLGWTKPELVRGPDTNDLFEFINPLDSLEYQLFPFGIAAPKLVVSSTELADSLVLEPIVPESPELGNYETRIVNLGSVGDIKVNYPWGQVTVVELYGYCIAQDYEGATTGMTGSASVDIEFDLTEFYSHGGMWDTAAGTLL